MARNFATGVIAGSTTATVLPNVYFGYQAWLAGVANNAGNVYLGNSTDVIIAGSTTDAVSGFQVTPGRMIILQGPGNLSSYYRICDNAGDDLSYMVES